MLDRTAALNPLEAYQALLRFARQRGENALRLALHAAVPQSFRPELLHLLRLNFLPEAANDHTVEADVLLAPFCEDIGGGYFQFDPEVRLLLLEDLDPSYAGNADSQLRRVARFLLYFIDQQAHSLKDGQNRLTQDYLEVQRWVALAFLNPAAAAEQLAAVLQQASAPGAVAARVRVSGLASTLAAPLVAYPQLLACLAGFEALETGRLQQDPDLLEQLPDEDVTVGKVTLHSPRRLLRQLLGPAGTGTGTTPGQAAGEAGKPTIKEIPYLYGWSTEQVQALQQQTAKALGLPVVFRDKFKDGSEGPELVVIPGGTFIMGGTEYDDEKPPHRITVSTFCLMRFPVTQDLYQAVLGQDRSEWKSEWKKRKDEERLPVNYVTWFDAVRFCNALSKRCGLQACYRIKGDHAEWDSAAEGYRLPTEAEWEYAVRAGTMTRWFCGDDEKELSCYAWYGESWDPEHIHPVSEKIPNCWGLYDMAGNVWEWCWDWYGPYQANAAADPVGPDSGSSRVLRGGAFVNWAGDLRSAFRLRNLPENRFRFIGFRCVRGSRRQP